MTSLWGHPSDDITLDGKRNFGDVIKIMKQVTLHRDIFLDYVALKIRKGRQKRKSKR